MTTADAKRDSNYRNAKKNLGQNFLQDRNIAEKIVNLLTISSEDRVLEIGPGPGALTAFILEAKPKTLILVEKDDYWAGVRKESMQAIGQQGRVLAQDALTVPWGDFTIPWKFVGNLPYNVASPLMWDMFSQAVGLTRAVFMVQKEVGLRLAAAPRSSEYGALSVWVQSYVRPVMEFIVPPQVFYPAPKVYSMVLSFTPRRHSERPENPTALARLLQGVFQLRRKQLGTIFRMHKWNVAFLEEEGLDTRMRPEELTVAQFMKLSCKIK